jgi:glycoside/pentoside/hexuronide:cation symporter, GPH family
MSSQTHHPTAPEDRIPWNQLIAYGAGGLIPIALFNIAGQLIGLIGNIGLGLSAFWLGVVLIIPRLWDAISDPVMGHISDNTRTPWGRRRPYLLGGAIAVALSFVLMWWVPKGDAVMAYFSTEAAYNWFQLGFILAGLLIFYTSCTIFEIPHGALGMEMSSDYHERTKLFSAKSFLGNLFAMGTPWLLFLAGLDFFKGPGGTLVDGMRYVSIFIAAALIPMAFWWFSATKEPGFVAVKEQQKSHFWNDMRTTITNKTFLSLVVIIFTLAMGFNFVNLFSYYITIFYLYGGDKIVAGKLLGFTGTVWAITGLVAVFPLNWISNRIGKNKTLIIAILLMCAAQVSKIVCYNPELPYLVIIPTILLSAGMLMFFTLGASMVGDICDEDDLKTGTRSEGSYYSVYWWFIKMGTAFASLVTGVLLTITHFDETQTTSVSSLTGHIDVIKAEAKKWETDEVSVDERLAWFQEKIEKTIADAEKLHTHFLERTHTNEENAQHTRHLIGHLTEIINQTKKLQTQGSELVTTPETLITQTDKLRKRTTQLTLQTPRTLLLLRIIEIGLPLLLSIVSLTLAFRYRLTEDICYDIKEALKERNAERAT